jgi:hypothetical protein
MPNLLGQERLVRGEVRHHALQAARVLIVDHDLAMLQARLAARQEVLTPLREHRGRHPMAATEALQRFPLEELDDHRDFPSCRPPPRADERRRG